jgi:hypothetical protein
LTILAISHQPAILEASDRAYRLQDGVAILVVERSDSCGGSARGNEDSRVSLGGRVAKGP